MKKIKLILCFIIILSFSITSFARLYNSNDVKIWWNSSFWTTSKNKMRQLAVDIFNWPSNKNDWNKVIEDAQKKLDKYMSTWSKDKVTIIRTSEWFIKFACSNAHEVTMTLTTKCWNWVIEKWNWEQCDWWSNCDSKCQLLSPIKQTCWNNLIEWTELCDWNSMPLWMEDLQCTPAWQANECIPKSGWCWNWKTESSLWEQCDWNSTPIWRTCTKECKLVELWSYWDWVLDINEQCDASAPMWKNWITPGQTKCDWWKIVKLTFCWDWIKQSINDNGQSEECDWIDWASDPTKICDSSCKIQQNNPSCLNSAVECAWTEETLVAWCDNIIKWWLPEPWSKCEIDKNWTSNSSECERFHDRKKIIKPRDPICNTPCVEWEEVCTTHKDWSETCRNVCVKTVPRWSHESNVPKPAIVYERYKTNIISSNIRCDDLYANNSDICKISYKITWDVPEPWINFSSLRFENIFFSKPVYVNQIDNEWNKWLNIATPTIDNNGNLDYNIKSKAPFRDDWDFSFDIKNSNWTNGKITESIFLDYKKPYIATLTVVDDSSLKIWTLQKIRLNVSKHSSVSSLPYTILDYTESFSLSSDNYIIQNKQKLSNIEANLRVNYKSNETVEDVILESKPQISYSLWWENILYYINSLEDWDNYDPISLFTDRFKWVKIIWLMQTYGKQIHTGQWVNISEIGAPTIRTTLKMNAYELIAWLKPSLKSLNWVLYVNWDYHIHWDLVDSVGKNYETLIVKNGNVYIDWNLNTWDKKLWIIVLRDNWSAIEKWNIYIHKDVTLVKSDIFAEWSFISYWWDSWSDKISNYSDSNTRTSSLNKQLIMYWTLFTRNTIWWAIIWNTGKYILPWWSETTDFNKAVMYDLNYTRRWNTWCDKNWNWVCTDSTEYDEPFVIIPRTWQTPKGF